MKRKHSLETTLLCLLLCGLCLRALPQDTVPPVPTHDLGGTPKLAKVDSADDSNKGGQDKNAAGDVAVAVISIDNCSLPNVISTLAHQAGLNIQLDPELFNQRGANGTPLPPPNVTVKWSKVTALEALQAILDNYELQMTKEPGAITRISARNPNAAVPQRTKVNFFQNATTNAAASSEDQVIPKIMLDGVALPDAIRVLAQQAGLNIQFDPLLPSRQDAKVAVNWQNLTPPQALQALLDIWGLEMTQLPGNPILRIEAKESGTVGWQATKTNLWQIVSTNGPAAAGDEVVTDIAMEKVALIDGVRTLALQAKLNIQFDPGLMNQKAADGSLNVSSIITQKWRNVTARQVLQELLDKHGWQMTQTPGIPIVRIVAKSP